MEIVPLRITEDTTWSAVETMLVVEVMISSRTLLELEVLPSPNAVVVPWPSLGSVVLLAFGSTAVEVTVLKLLSTVVLLTSPHSQQ